MFLSKKINLCQWRHFLGFQNIGLSGFENNVKMKHGVKVHANSRFHLSLLLFIWFSVFFAVNAIELLCAAVNASTMFQSQFTILKFNMQITRREKGQVYSQHRQTKLKKFTFLFQQFCQTRIIVMTNKHVQLNWTFVSLAHFASKFCQVNIRRSILKPTWHSHVISPSMARYSKSFWWFHLEIEINVQNFHLDLKRIKPNIAA